MDTRKLELIFVSKETGIRKEAGYFGSNRYDWIYPNYPALKESSVSKRIIPF